jgi:RWD domain.
MEEVMFDEWKENVELQLEELELLRSMFPQEKELILEDIALESDLKIWMASDSDQAPPCRLAFRLNLNIQETHVEASVTLPKEYPTREKPEVYLRCNEWIIHTQSEANQALQIFMTALEFNELMLGNVVAWIQGELMDHLPGNNEAISPNSETASSDLFSRVEGDPLIRYWIYSHHIYVKSSGEIS